MAVSIYVIYLLVAVSYKSVCGALTADELNTFKDECLAAHNALRALHVDTPGMTWSDEIATGAKQWAEDLNRRGVVEHDHHTSYGENIFWASWSGCGYKTCSDAVLSWYNEITDYDYNTHQSINSNAVGHFTQVAWKASTQVGVGIAYGKTSSGNARVYIVARYNPPGNYNIMRYDETVAAAKLRNWEENVKPRKSGSITPSAAQIFSGSYVGQCGDCKDLNSACPNYSTYCDNPRSPSIAQICPLTCGRC